ncbi:MAG: YkvA family protein [Vicinamibacteria bacterium]
MVRSRPYAVIASRLRDWARRLKRDVLALYLAAHDPRVPWPAKIVSVAVAAYALSPIDLIPDFIPVLGYLDDLLIVPLGILLAVKLVPPELMVEFRAAASDVEHPPALGRWGAAFVIGLWVLGAAVAAVWVVRLIRSH